MPNLTVPLENSAAREPVDVAAIAARMCRVMGSVSVLAAAFPDDVDEGEPEYRQAALAIYDDLDHLLAQLGILDDVVRLGGRLAIRYDGEAITATCRPEP